jgi:putative membrane protein
MSWLWHIPALYKAALADPWIPWLQLLSLFVTTLHTGFLGILLALLRRPIYPAQTLGAAEWGLKPLEDQQLAGFVMWIPAGIVYVGAALVLAGLWIARSGSPRSGGGHHAYAAR